MSKPAQTCRCHAIGAKGHAFRNNLICSGCRQSWFHHQHCQEDCPNTNKETLIPEEVSEIRRLYKAKMSENALARKFSVSRRQIKNVILHRAAWEDNRVQSTQPEL